MDLIKSNIENLTNLWALAGKEAGIFKSSGDYAMSYVKGSEWPNRLWFSDHNDRTKIESILNQSITDHLTIPVWGDHYSHVESKLEAAGFEIKFKQTGMYFPMGQVTVNESPLHMKKVDDFKSAISWSVLFEEAFSYRIEHETIIKTMDKVEYFIGLHEGIPVGTAMLYIHDPEIAGIHSMGIIPGMRRKGFAQEMLNGILAIAKAKKAEYATLQASEMGEGLYLKTGFKEQFRIKNFVKSKRKSK